MKLIISGSRNMNSYDFFEEQVFKIIGAKFFTEVLTGCNPDGADHFADMFARKYQINFHRLAAHWTVHGDKAGPWRNDRLVQAICPEDTIVAFPGPASKGTRDFIAKAIKVTLAENMHIIDVAE